MKGFVQVPKSTEFVCVANIIHFYDDGDKREPTLTIVFKDSDDVEFENCSASDFAAAIKRED